MTRFSKKVDSAKALAGELVAAIATRTGIAQPQRGHVDLARPRANLIGARPDVSARDRPGRVTA